MKRQCKKFNPRLVVLIYLLMAISKPFIPLLLLSLLLLHVAEADYLVKTSEPSISPPNPTPSLPPPKIDCGWLCFWRCILSKRGNMCRKACGSCCAQCNCVPPGTYGNYEACACYAGLKTHGGKRKCP